MILETEENAELIVTTLFKIENLKQTIRNENNLKLLDYLESYKHMNYMLNQLAGVKQNRFFGEKTQQLSNYINTTIEFSEKGNHCLQNIAEAEEILKDIRQRLELIAAMTKKNNQRNF